MSGQPARITTDRLVLREYRPGDIEDYAAMCADPAVMRYSSPDGAVLSREDAWRQMAMFAGHWALRGLPHHLYRLVRGR